MNRVFGIELLRAKLSNHQQSDQQERPMRSGVILSTNAGHVAAEGYLEQALANNQSCAGFGVYSGGKLHISRIQRPDLKTLKDVFEGLKEDRINMHLANYPDGYMLDDIQPFVLVGDDANATVACMLDGDWANNAPAGGKHSDEFFVALNILRPMFTQLHRLTKGDVKALIEEVDGEATTNALKNTFVNRGNIHLMFSNGEVRTITKNELEKEFDWGWVSNHYLYGEEKPPVPEPIPEQKPNPLAALMGNKAIKVAVEEKKEEAKPSLLLPPVIPPKAVKAKPAVGDKVACPREIKRPHKVQAWYKDICGYAPSNFLEYPEVEVKISSGPVAKEVKPAVKTLAELGSALGTTATRVVLPDVKSTPAQIAERQPPKLPGPNLMPAVQPLEKLPAEPEKKDVIPSMSPETQKKIIDNFLKATESLVITTDRSGNKILDPKDAPALEGKYTSFAERIGVKLDDIFTWKTERLEKLLYEFPDGMLHLTCDLRRELAQAQKALAAVVAPTSTVILPKLGRKTA